MILFPRFSNSASYVAVFMITFSYLFSFLATEMETYVNENN